MPNDKYQDASWDTIARAVFEATAQDGEASADLLNACRALPELRVALVELPDGYDVQAFDQRTLAALGTAHASSPAELAHWFESVSMPVGTPSPSYAAVGATGMPAPAKPTGPTEALLYEVVAAHVISHALAGIADFLQTQVALVRKQRPDVIDANPVLREWADSVRSVAMFVKAGEKQAPEALAKQLQSFRIQDEECVKPPQDPPISAPPRPPIVAVLSLVVATLVVVMLAMWSWAVLLGGGAR